MITLMGIVEAIVHEYRVAVASRGDRSAKDLSSHHHLHAHANQIVRDGRQIRLDRAPGGARNLERARLAALHEDAVRARRCGDFSY